MKIRILAIGKLKEKYWKDAIGEYAKRLKPYVDFEVLEGGEEEAPQGLSPKEAEVILKKEGDFFRSKIKGEDYSIALDLEGKPLSSTDLAAVVEREGMMSGRRLNFLIGGSLGLDEGVKRQCQLRISFGRATLPHQLMRVVLTEQIYRTMKIIKKEPYHK